MKLNGIIPGSSEERKAVELLIQEMKNIVDYVDTLNIPVYKWDWSCECESNELVSPCILMPYSQVRPLEIRPSDIVLVKDLNNIVKQSLNLYEKVGIMKYPTSITELRYVLHIVARYDPLAIIFFTEKPGYLKADTVLASFDFTYSPSMPISFPVISMDSTTAENMIKHGGFIKGYSSLEKSTGTIVIGYLNTRGENNIHLFSHHDSIIGEVGQASSFLLLNVLKGIKISIEELPVNIIMVSYTAREIGDAEFTSYHYTWGERYLLRIMENRGELERTLFSVSIGPLTGEDSLLSIAHPLFHDVLADHNLTIRDNHFALESHPYMEYGIPSVVFIDHGSTYYRNSTLKPDTKGSYNSIVKLSRIILNLIKKYNISLDIVDYIRRYTYQVMNEQPVEVRTIVARAIDLLKPYSNNIFEFLRVFTRVSYMYFHTTCSDPVKAHLDYSMWSSLSKNNTALLDELLSTCRHDLLVKTNACNTWISKPLEFFKQEFKKNLKENIVKYLSSLLNYEITKKTCINRVEREECGKESSRN